MDTMMRERYIHSLVSKLGTNLLTFLAVTGALGSFCLYIGINCFQKLSVTMRRMAWVSFSQASSTSDLK